MASSHVFDVTAATFDGEVIRRSARTPVLLDFWADWCAPCRTLGPVLEQAAEEYGGAFVVGKIDTEKEQELAYAFQVRSIPFVVLVKNGRPVDAFAGAVGEREVRQFLGAHGIEPSAAGAAEAAPDPDSPEAKLAEARRAAARAQLAEARAALEGVPEESPLHAEKERLLEGLELLEADLDPGQSPAAEPLIRAREHVLAGRFEPAMEAILESVSKDKNFRGGLGRKAMLLCFALAGEESELAESYRRRLATLLY